MKTAADAISPTVVFLMCHLFAVTLFQLLTHAIDMMSPASPTLGSMPKNKRKHIAYYKKKKLLSDGATTFETLMTHFQDVFRS